MCRRKSKKDLLSERMGGFVLKTGQWMRSWIVGWCLGNGGVMTWFQDRK